MMINIDQYTAELNDVIAVLKVLGEQNCEHSLNYDKDEGKYNIMCKVDHRLNADVLTEMENGEWTEDRW